jgi:integrase/recombinase XerD
MTPLREKMDDDLRLRNLSVNTRKTYLHQVSRFARFFGKSPAELGTAEVRTYLLNLEASGRAPATRALAYGALQFLYVHTLHQPEVMAPVPRPRHGPCGEVNPLLRSEVKAMLQAAEADVLDTTLLSTLLGTGLRNAELRNLRVGDIDRSAGLLYVRRGKGGKARCVQLGDPLYLLLRRYWSELRPPGPWVFPAMTSGTWSRPDPRTAWAAHPISQDSLRRRLARIAHRAGLKRKVTPHDLRRTYATWLLEAGVDLHVVQVLLGHTNPNTTTRYTRVRPDLIRQTLCPLDLL